MTTQPLFTDPGARTKAVKHKVDIAELEQLRAELAEAKETLRAIQSGDVDAIIVSSPEGDRLFTLKGAEYAYRLLVEAMNEGAATLSHNGIVLYCNKQLPEFVKLTQEKVIGQHVLSFIPQEHIDSFNALFVGALGGTPGKSEIELMDSEGGLIPVQLSVSRIQNEDSPAVCMVVTDLSKHKEREAVIAAGNLARAILDQAVEPIAVCDTTGTIIIANNALQHLCIDSPLFALIADVLPMQVSDASGTRSPFSWMHAMRDHVDGYRMQEVILNRADAIPSWLLLTVSPLKNEADVNIGFLVTLLDVTERKLAEQALLRSEKLAALGRMAATMSHEINNPLASVMNAIFIAQGAENLPDSTRKYLEIADTELKRIAQITRQSLGFYRDSNAPQVVKVNEVLESALDLLRNKILAKGAIIEKRSQVVEITAVAGELRQVFCNLLANSLDAINNKGSIKLRVSSCSAPRNGQPCVRVTVADNGQGISTASRMRLFEPLFTTKGMTGTGLGLWVSKQIIDKHGGTIRVRSRNQGVRTGTVFSIVLPVKPPALASSKSA